MDDFSVDEFLLSSSIDEVSLEPLVASFSPRSLLTVVSPQPSMPRAEAGNYFEGGDLRKSLH